MNEVFRAQGYTWRTAEYHFGYDVPKELHPQDWILTDGEQILALGDGPTRYAYRIAPSRDVALARLAQMNIRCEEQREELLATVCPPPPAYPSAEEFYQTLRERRRG